MTSEVNEQVDQDTYKGSQSLEGNHFTGSSLASLAPRDTYVTHQEVLDADKKFFTLVEEKKTKDVLELIHKYNGYVMKSKHGAHMEWVPPEVYPPPEDEQRLYKPNEGVGGWYIPPTPTHASQRLLPETLRQQSRPGQKTLDLDSLSSRGETALMIAARNGDINMAKILLEEGAEVNFTNKQGLTALAVAAANNRNYMLSFLHRNGASINKPTNEGLTPLHIATTQNNDKMAGYIIDRDGDFNGKHHGRSPIDYVDNSWKFKRVNIENIGGPITKAPFHWINERSHRPDIHPRKDAINKIKKGCTEDVELWGTYRTVRSSMEVSNGPWELVHKQTWGSKSHKKPEPISPRTFYNQKGRELLKEGSQFLMYDHDSVRDLERVPPALDQTSRLPEIIKDKQSLQLAPGAGKIEQTVMVPPSNFGAFPAQSKAQMESPQRKSTLSGAPPRYSF